MIRMFLERWSSSDLVVFQVANYARLACLVSGQAPHDLQKANGQRETTKPWFMIPCFWVELQSVFQNQINLLQYCCYLRFTQNSLIEKQYKMNSLSCVAGWRFTLATSTLRVPGTQEERPAHRRSTGHAGEDRGVWALRCRWGFGGKCWRYS